MKAKMKQAATRIVSLLVVVSMLIGLAPSRVFSAGETLLSLEELRAEYGAITIEAYNIGQGFLAGPALFKKEGKSAGDITADFLTGREIGYQGDVSYFTGFEFDDTQQAEYPEYLSGHADELESTGDGDGYLGASDYSAYAGWTYTINDWWASLGASDAYPGQEITDYNTQEPVLLGDVIRWHFTVYGYGADCGFPGNAMASYMGGNLFTQEDKTELLFILAAIGDYYGNLETDDVYETALAVAADPLATAETIAAQEGALRLYIEKNFLAGENQSAGGQDVSAVLNATMAKLAADVTAPTFGSTAGEWTVLALARGEYYATNASYFSEYYDRIVTYVNETAGAVPGPSGALSQNKSTDNSRLILALSAIGRDARNVGNWNLIAPYEDFEWISKQGINGVIYALLALDANKYQTTDAGIRAQCVDYLLEKQLEDGGWALFGTTADPDITATALQALAPYRSQTKAAAGAEKAFARLSALQSADGGFTSWGTANAESCAQVIIACTAWGINPDTDERFVKNGASVLDALLGFYLAESVDFEHAAGAGANAMATDQACHALIAYHRLRNGKTALYDCSDVSFEENDGAAQSAAPKATLSLPAQITGEAGSHFTAGISIDRWDNAAGRKLIDFVMHVPAGLRVLDVTAGERLSGGAVSLHLEEETGKLRVVYFDAAGHGDLTVSGSAFPAQLFTVTFETDGALSVDRLAISLGGMSLKTSSNSSDENAMIIVDTQEASGSVAVVKGLSFRAVCLYTGDDIDLIPSTKKAVAVSVVGAEGVSGLIYRDGTNEYSFKYSAQISEKAGAPTYVALTDASIPMSSFAEKANFTLTKTDAAAIAFGDSNGDGVINAQDALAAVDLWLRKAPAPTDDVILAMNVNGDGRINTFDALGIVEAFVDGSDYLVVTGAAALMAQN